MNLIVVGCGRVGAELAERLSQRGNQVVVIDQSEDAFHNLPADFKGRMVEGQALSKDVLRRAGISQADGLAAVTSSDSINAVVAHIAREEYNVPSVVVRNFNSRWRSMHEAFGLQVVSSSSWGAQRIEELLYQQETRTVFSAGNGEVELYEFLARPELEGRPLSDLIPASGCVVAALSRAGRAVIPEPGLLLKEGDAIVVSATLDGSEALRQRLKVFYQGGSEKERQP
jgi:trk system potassium uptake protein TrkA